MEARTRLLPDRTPPAEDETIVRLIESLPDPSSFDRAARAGITDQNGDVYREVFLYSLLDMLHLTARLNTIGYKLNPGLRKRCGWHYSIIFSPSRLP